MRRLQRSATVSMNFYLCGQAAAVETRECYFVPQFGIRSWRFWQMTPFEYEMSCCSSSRIRLCHLIYWSAKSQKIIADTCLAYYFDHKWFTKWNTQKVNAFLGVVQGLKLLAQWHTLQQNRRKQLLRFPRSSTSCRRSRKNKAIAQGLKTGYDEAYKKPQSDLLTTPNNNRDGDLKVIFWRSFITTTGKVHW